VIGAHKRAGRSDEAGPARKKDFLMHHPAPPFGVAGTILYLAAAGQHPTASSCSAQHGLGQSGGQGSAQHGLGQSRGQGSAQHGLGQSRGQGSPQHSLGGFSAQHGLVRPAGHVSGLNAAATWLEADASVFSAK